MIFVAIFRGSAIKDGSFECLSYNQDVKIGILLDSDGTQLKCISNLFTFDREEPISVLKIGFACILHKIIE